MGRLDGRVALVTGAAQGIGEATARMMAAEGVRVACADVNVDGVQALASELGGLALGGSVSDAAAAADWVKQIVDRFGQLDVLINNAGITRDAMSHKMTMDQWDAVLEVNLKGSFVCAQAARWPCASATRGQSSIQPRLAPSATLARQTTRPPRRASSA